MRNPQLIVVPSDAAGERLDRFLVAHLPTLSRSQIQRLIRDGRVTVGGRLAKPGLVVEPGLRIEVDIPPPEPAGPRPEALPLSILYDDEDLAVVDKPAGMVVHPAAGHRGGTLVNALLHHIGGLSGIGGVARPGIVHRLDRGTSGVMVVAKHDAAHRHLARQFHDRLVEKEYVALVWGTPAPGLRLDLPIGRDRRQRQKMSTRTSRGRAALTEIVDVEKLNGVSLVRVRIGTGRTHQIRVHLSELGHAVVGDATYGGVRRRVPAALSALGRLERPFLHAHRLSLTHPRTGGRLTFEAPLPPELAVLLDRLRQAAPRGVRT